MWNVVDTACEHLSVLSDGHGRLSSIEFDPYHAAKCADFEGHRLVKVVFVQMRHGDTTSQDGPRTKILVKRNSELSEGQMDI